MSFSLLILRTLIGALFGGHGAQKAYAAGGNETAGGALLALGLGTPAAAAGLTGVVGTAAATVHRPNGPAGAQAHGAAAGVSS
jgi:uncharacterized membrane protein YphA (DoxX/SURF4 family)